MAKINLTPREPKKKKDKYSESPSNEHKFSLQEKMIYVGIITKHFGLDCEIIKRGKKKDINHYKVKFDDEEELEGIAEWFLKTKEEYEQWLAEQENKEDTNKNEMSDEEKKIIALGLEPYKNKFSCLNQEFIATRSCEQCGYESRCIYVKKYKYDKLKF